MRSRPLWAASASMPRLCVARPTPSFMAVRKIAAMTEDRATVVFSRSPRSSADGLAFSILVFEAPRVPWLAFLIYKKGPWEGPTGLRPTAPQGPAAPITGAPGPGVF
jgi:hypothetical protein